MNNRIKRLVSILARVVITTSLLFIVNGPTPTHANSIVVNTASDETTAGDGLCSLREAITNANNAAQTYSECTSGSAASNTITFSVSGPIVLDSTNGPLSIGGTDLTISGPMTISGGNTTQILSVGSSGTSLTLNNLTLTDALNSIDGGAIVSHGTLNINDSKFLNNDAASGFSGGAIESFGTMNITNSEFGNNSAGNGGALFLKDSSVTSITGSSVHDNHTTNTTNGFGGAMLVWNGAQLNVDSTSFVGNGARHGGAMYVTSVSVVTVTNSSLSGNSTSFDGGALYNAGSGTLDHVVLQDNHSDFGSGIENEGTLSISHSTLDSNSGVGDGGAIENVGVLTLTTSMLSGNSTGDDGAGLNNVGTATVDQSTFTGNRSGNPFSDGAGGAMRNDGNATLTNSTLSGNAATEGGGIANYGRATLTNVTLSANAAPQGGGIWQYGQTAASTLNLKNTIVANSPSGGNCYELSASKAPITSLGNNLSSDAFCAPYFTNTGDQNNKPAQLGPLANNGGSTLTHLPLPPITPGSGPIDNGSCPYGSFDQRGVFRPQGAACDIGSVEYRAGDVTPWLYLPLVMKDYHQ